MSHFLLLGPGDLDLVYPIEGAKWQSYRRKMCERASASFYHLFVPKRRHHIWTREWMCDSRVSFEIPVAPLCPWWYAACVLSYIGQPRQDACDFLGLKY